MQKLKLTDYIFLKKIVINKGSLIEKNNKFNIKKMTLNHNFNVIDLERIEMDYNDKDENTKSIKINQKKTCFI